VFPATLACAWWRRRSRGVQILLSRISADIVAMPAPIDRDDEVRGPPVHAEKGPRLYGRGLRCEPLGHGGGGAGSADLDNRPSAAWFRSGIGDRANIESAQLHRSSTCKPGRL
jgi:hypothetical protein